MNRITYVSLFMSIMVLLCQCSKPTDIKVVIYDNRFLNALIKQGVDTDGDSTISTAEAKAVKSLDISNYYSYEDIYDVTGIEAFINLTKLFCGSNLIRSLDVSNIIGLEELACENNKLTRLDVSKNVALKSLYCYSNQLTSLDVSKNVVLKSLYCSGNDLTHLEITSKRYQVRVTAMSFGSQ